jgi:hypothetical protein
MKRLLFLARLALICNLLFMVCLVLQRRPDTFSSQAVKGTVIVLGWLIAPFLNFAANTAYFIVRLKGKNLNFPLWLAVTNFLFLLLQFFIHFILPS